MATDRQQPTRGDYPRVCDICGHRFLFSQLRPIGELRWACPDDAPGLTANQISRFNARAKPLIVRPRKYAKDYIQTPIYQLAEAQIFNFIAQTAPAGEPDGASDPLAAAWAAIYMADVLGQDKRPLNWERTAVSTLTRCCDYLLTLQYGAPTSANPTGTADNPRYGGILSGTVRSTAISVAAGVAFLKAYLQTGSSSYFQGARRAATFVRHVQCGHLQATAYTVYPSGGGRYQIGGLASSVDDTTGLLAVSYLVADIAGAWFLKLLADVQGDTTAYGDVAATAFFSAPTRATLATMLAELTAFGETGARDAASAGAFVTGLSTTAPKLSYSAAVNGGGGAAAWTAAGEIRTRDFALALLGLFTAGGTTAKVAEMMAWLAAFGSNSNNYTPATLYEPLIVEGITGTYDPSLCPADRLASSAPFTESDQALYDWASFGVLSPILAGDQTALRRSKDTLSTSVRYSFYDIENKWLGPLGSSGLSLQPLFRNASGQLVGVSGAPGTSGSVVAVTPPTTGLVFWVKGDSGLTSVAGVATTWSDQSGLGQHVTNALTPGPFTGLDTIDGVPCITLPLDGGFGANPLRGLSRGAGLVDRNGAHFGYGVGEHQARTIVAVIKPRFSSTVFNITGGIVAEMGSTPSFQPIFDLEDTVHVNGFYVFSSGWRDPGGGALQGPDAVGGTGGTYDGVPLIAAWTSSGFPNISFSINGVDLTVTPSVMPGATGPTVNPVFTIGRQSSGGFDFFGAMAEMLIFDYALSGSALTQLFMYLNARYPSISSQSFPSSVVRAARTGMVYRQSPGRYPLMRGN